MFYWVAGGGAEHERRRAGPTRHGRAGRARAAQLGKLVSGLAIAPILFKWMVESSRRLDWKCDVPSGNPPLRRFFIQRTFQTLPVIWARQANYN